jgi:pimeloyl-ACP methyl ester carboxylesterase
MYKIHKIINNPIRYNNEHGPLRIRLPFCVNGFRYRATDLDASTKGSLPEWLAVYDITDMAEMEKETYLALRGDTIKTQREKDTMAQIVVGRKLFDLVSENSIEGFKPLETVGIDPPGTVLIARAMTLNREIKDAEKDFNEWYEEEHTPLLSKVPGWRRTRRYKTCYLLDGKEETEFLALHEYEAQNGLGGPEFKAATSTQWREKVFSTLIKSQWRRTYKLYLTFGPAPRELAALLSPDTKPWSSIDGMTRTFPATSTNPPAVESFVTTSDNVILPYRLEGATSPDAPLIILINSILVTHNIWDNFVSAFLATNPQYRILRYNSRGRSSEYGPKDKEITLDVLAADTIAILDALRVPKAAAVVGVSVGGATTLNVALKYPSRVGAFVACDFNATSSPGNVKAWDDRVALAKSDESVTTTGSEREVGEVLAEATVRRWFVPGSYEDKKIAAEILRTKEMVKSNNLEGFQRSIRALYEYDLKPLTSECDVPGLLVVGAGDGALPGAMAKIAEGLKRKTECVVIADAGHLPMIEKPEEFAGVVSKFLRSL